MKGLKKLLTGILAATMIISSSITAFAATEGDQPVKNTITVQNAEKNETYSIYRLLDLQVSADALAAKDSKSGYSYTINSDWEGFWTGVGADYINVTKDADGNLTNPAYVTWKDANANMEEFGKLAAAYAKENNVATAAPSILVDDNNEAKFTDLDNGYYMVTSTLGSAVSIASTPSNPQQFIYEKNKTTTTEKQVLDAEASSESSKIYGQSNDAQIGDTVTFRSKVHIAKNQVNVKYLDVMTEGLTYQKDAKVYTDEDCTTELDSTKYTPNHDGVTYDKVAYTFEVAFHDDYVAAFKEATTLYIKYTAKLNDKAQVANAEKNTPVVTYGNGGKQTGEPTETTTYKFSILKYDGVKFTNENDPDIPSLAGAKFELIDKTDNNNRKTVKLAVSKDGLTYRVVNDAKDIPDGYKVVESNEIETTDTGKITVIGVDNRKYCLVETEAPLGFNKIEGDIDLEIGTSNALVKKIPNLSGTLLPSTGGIGTTIFYILGGILIVAGVAYFIVRRKASAE